MSWFVLAILGHLSNGFSFVIDKALLRTAFKRSATYASLIGILSLATIVLIPWAEEIPSAEAFLWIVPFGGFFVFGLWAFFEALRRAEGSRVVPIVGSLVPLITLLETTTLFSERLEPKQYLGFIVLLVATWLLTTGTHQTRIHRHTLGLCILAAFFFATASVTGKVAFEKGDFIAVLIASRLVASIFGIAIGAMAIGARQEIMAILFGKHASSTAAKTSRIWPIIGQLCGGVGFILIHLALTQGSAALINSLQAVQYALLIIVALVLRSLAPQLLDEQLDTRSIRIKIGAIILTAIGLALVA